MRPSGCTMIEKTRKLPAARGRRALARTLELRFCVSCPNFVPESRTKLRVPLRHFSLPRTRPVSYVAIQPFTRTISIPFPLGHICSPCLLPNASQVTSTRNYSSCNKGCPCPFPCGPCGGADGCGCLPPPCNQPPRCIQYMTGYYYYPYGVWFCGPYHVCGTCKPGAGCSSGPCGPCGPSGPCGPCGPCGPSGPCGSCGPCGPCGLCGACEPCAPCGPCKPCSPKCPCPVCVCPGAAVGMLGETGSGPKSKPKSGIVPGNQIQTPLPRDGSGHARKGISKFFPFYTAAPPMAMAPNETKTKYRMPPSISSLITPYSTQASHNTDNFCSESNKQSYIYEKLTSTQYAPTCNSSSNKSSYETPCIGRCFSECDKRRSSIHHDRCINRYVYESCPPLEKPRVIPGKNERDKPKVKPGFFNYSAVPIYKNPYPQSNNTFSFKAFDS